jgi:L-fucose dehydrogenase
VTQPAPPPRTALVTGGTQGIGAGCARVFHEHGVDVVVCAPDVTGGEALVAELDTRRPGSALFVECDVRFPDQIAATVAAAVERFGRLDCLINNAGVGRPGKTLVETTLAEIEELVATNLVSCVVASQLALPHLRATRGTIVNIGSLAGRVGHDRAAVYAATKGAIGAFTKALAVEEASHGVRVNAVLPGNILTESRRRYEEASSDPQGLHDHVETWQWLGRSGLPAEVGRACYFLASDDATFITGAELIVSGGAELGFGPKQPVRFGLTEAES